MQCLLDFDLMFCYKFNGQIESPNVIVEMFLIQIITFVCNRLYAYLLYVPLRPLRLKMEHV